MRTIYLVLAVLMMVVTLHTMAEARQEVEGFSISEYIHWYPAMKQIEMRDIWLSKYKPGEWQITGLVTAEDRTVVTAQADVNYGYSWFNISNEPVAVTMPKYDKYYSLTVFDMHHFMEVIVAPEKPVVVRLPHQKSPVEDAHEIVLQTNQGLAFTRQVVVNNEEEVLKLAEQIKIEGGGGTKPFIVPDFTEAEKEAAEIIIKDYALKIPNARKLFGSTYEGVGDLDRCAGVFLGQLGTQSYIVDYAQYNVDQHGKALTGADSYEIVVPSKPLIRNNKGYWNFTIYNMEDRYLIPNPENRYVISSYTAKKNSDGTATIRINPKGTGVNALPTMGKTFYGVFRVYEPAGGLEFPTIEKVAGR